MTNKYIDFIGEPMTTNGKIIKIFPRTDKDKPLYVAYETDCVGVYANLMDASQSVSKLATISHLEWDEHDRAGENGSCSLCDGTHMITQTLTPWRTTLTEVFLEEYKGGKFYWRDCDKDGHSESCYTARCKMCGSDSSDCQEIGDLPINTSAHLIEL